MHYSKIAHIETVYTVRQLIPHISAVHKLVNFWSD
jgi:hypothetical protein